MAPLACTSIHFHGPHSEICKPRSPVAGTHKSSARSRAHLTGCGYRHSHINHGHSVSSSPERQRSMQRIVSVSRSVAQSVRSAQPVWCCSIASTARAACLPATLSPNQISGAMASSSSRVVLGRSSKLTTRMQPNHSLKRNANSAARRPSSAGPSAHFALAVQRATPLASA